MLKQTQCILSLLIILVVVSISAAETDKETKRIEYAIDVLEAITSIPEKTIPERLLKSAHGLAIIPGVVKGAFGLGGRWGLGIVTVRTDTGWSYPSFISVTGGSAGWQFGAQSTDFVLVFRTARSIENIKKGKFTFGGDVSVTAGPVGRNAEASTDIQLKSEIYSYARSKGLFIGASIEGTSMRIDKKANKRFYRSDVSAEDILTGKIDSVPPIINELDQTLDRITAFESKSKDTIPESDEDTIDSSDQDTIGNKKDTTEDETDTTENRTDTTRNKKDTTGAKTDTSKNKTDTTTGNKSNDTGTKKDDTTTN